jgi:hypothetical protein
VFGFVLSSSFFKKFKPLKNIKTGLSKNWPGETLNFRIRPNYWKNDGFTKVFFEIIISLGIISQLISH